MLADKDNSYGSLYMQLILHSLFVSQYTNEVDFVSFDEAQMVGQSV